LKFIKSINYDQEEIIEDILRLYVPSGKIDLDPTYSKGSFYKSGRIQEPKLKYDIKPQVINCLQGDCRDLSMIEDNSLNCIIFDPPFLATTGKSLTENRGKENNILNKRFGVYPNEKELDSLYYDSLVEFNRILKKDGILIFKCQDKVSSGKQHWCHCNIYNYAKELGFAAEDLFVLLAKNRLVAKWQIKNQKHARKYHCYFWVLKKIK
jgi:hypothetical protein